MVSTKVTESNIMDGMAVVDIGVNLTHRFKITGEKSFKGPSMVCVVVASV
jgi:5,10-methylene-tetrahydrofolate dehydrogenase/methenyl tetrahydrofolate cyclohydrolase